MGGVTDIRNRPFSLLDGLLGVAGSLAASAAGGYLVFVGTELARYATDASRPFIGVLGVVIGLVLLAGGLYALYATIALPLDRSVKLSLTEDSLIDRYLDTQLLQPRAECRGRFELSHFRKAGGVCHRSRLRWITAFAKQRM